LKTFVRKARGLAVVGPIGQVYVPKIGFFGKGGDDVVALVGVAQTVRAEEFINREAHGHGAGVANRVFGVGDDFAKQAQAVFK
jgi:hypothetical protein